MSTEPDVELLLNGAAHRVGSGAAAVRVIREERAYPFAEVCLHAPDEKALCLLINRDAGWLMYLRWNGDSGFSSRNPQYAGPADAVREYRLSNGQVDVYPAAWALALEELLQAAAYFVDHRAMAPFISWHED